MRSRELISDETSDYQFLIDTASINHVQEFSPLYRFLRYRRYDTFDYLRSPGDTSSEDLQRVPEYTISDENPNGFSISWQADSWSYKRAVLYNPGFWQERFDSEGLKGTISEKEKLLSVVRSLAGNQNKKLLFVTNDEKLLRNRARLESDLRNRKGQPSINFPREVAEFIGVYMRSRRDYYFYPTEGYEFRMHLTPWYSALNRLLLNYTDPNSHLPAISDEFQSLFIAIDQLGEEYYSGVNRDTDIMTRHYFHNSITLLTGVFDTLALYAMKVCGTEASQKEINLKYNDDALINDLEREYPHAERVLEEHKALIDLIHRVRNEVVHSSGLITRGPGSKIRGENGETVWTSHFLSTANFMHDDLNEIIKNYQYLDDSVKEFDPITEWGVLVGPEEDEIRIDSSSWIEPYQFIKKAVSEVCELTNDFLEAMDTSQRAPVEDRVGLVPSDEREIVAEEGLYPLLFKNIDLSGVRE